VPDDLDSEWVALTTRFTPGWPWPEESYGLDPMFGPDGWCRSCGTPLRPQIGPLTIQGRKFPTANVWMPNWMFDMICVAPDLAGRIRDRFSVAMREVHKPRHGATGVMQLLPTVTRQAWYVSDQLAVAVKARHGHHYGDQTGARCPGCGHWRWLPVGEGDASLRSTSVAVASDAIASPEIFGDGLTSFRHLLFRRPLGEALVAANPRTWSMVAVEFTAA
jgi:hypothetical protein